MTTKHRDRLLLSLALVVVLVGTLTAPIAASAGTPAALGIAAITAIPALLLLGVVAYVVHAKDRERARYVGPSSSRD